jgi:hypothetical protein
MQACHLVRGAKPTTADVHIRTLATLLEIL